MKLKFKMYLLLCFILLGGSSIAQVSVYKERITTLHQAISTHLTDYKNGLYFESTDSSKNENPNSWLWPICAIYQGAHEMEVLEPGKSYMKPVELAFAQYYDPKEPIGAYQDYVFKAKTTTRYYDDNQWLAITYLDSHRKKRNKTYLEQAKNIYRFMMTGWDDVTGGGIYWREGDKTTKNTCSNGPGAVVALQLYNATKKKEYLKSGLAIYDWTQKNLQDKDGLYFDAIKIPKLNLDKAKFTYNTGTMLQSAVLLYNITHDKKYLEEAKRVAKSARKYFFKGGRLPNEYWFNAVMLRGFYELYKVDRNPVWIDFFKQDAEEIWLKERDTNNLVGKKKERRLIDQGAMIEIYALLAQAENLK